MILNDYTRRFIVLKIGDERIPSGCRLSYFIPIAPISLKETLGLPGLDEDLKKLIRKGIRSDRSKPKYNIMTRMKDLFYKFYFNVMYTRWVQLVFIFSMSLIGTIMSLISCKNEHIRIMIFILMVFEMVAFLALLNSDWINRGGFKASDRFDEWKHREDVDKAQREEQKRIENDFAETYDLVMSGKYKQNKDNVK